MTEETTPFNLEKCKEHYNTMKATKPLAYAKLSETFLNKPVEFVQVDSTDMYGRVVFIDKNTFTLTVKCWSLLVIDNLPEGAIKLTEKYFHIPPMYVNIVEEKDLVDFYTIQFEQALLSMFQNAVMVHGTNRYTLSNLDMSDATDISAYINAQSNFISSANRFMRKSVNSYVNRALLLKNNDIMLCCDYVVTDEAGKGLEGYKISFTGDAMINVVKYIVAENTTQFSIDDVVEKSYKIGLDCFDENINTVIDNWLNIISPNDGDEDSEDAEVRQGESVDSNK